MDIPKKIDDCYFYYYSTCVKGDSCLFRHEPTALGCETVCFHWTQGECFDRQCKLRHMELKKNRKQIPCYWEKQPGGCKKKHCSFRHADAGASVESGATGQNVPSQQPVQPVPFANEGWQAGVPKDGEPFKNVAPPNMPSNSMPPYAGLHQAENPLVVNFGEESDNDSIAGSTPIKSRIDLVESSEDGHLEELLQLKQIQNEVAAFYNSSISISDNTNRSTKAQRRSLPSEYENLTLDQFSSKVRKISGSFASNPKDFKILTLNEIRQSKQKCDVSNDSFRNVSKRKLF